MEEHQTQKPEILSSSDPKATDALQNMLTDPAMLTRLMGVIGALQGGGATQPPSSVSTEAPSQKPASPAPPPADGLMTLLADPAFAERLPQIIAMLKPLLAAMPPSTAPQSGASVPASISHTPHSHTSERDNLLLSLKPFLSGERRDAIDSILRISKLGEVIRQIK